MGTLDRYIIRQFLINFVILLLVFTMLFVLVDLIVDMDEFVKAGRLRADEFGGQLPAIVWTVVTYYGPLLLLLYVFFSGLLVVGAMGFALAGLARSRELTAMASSGISLYRVAAPIVVVGGLLNVLTLLDQEFVIPNLAYRLTRSKSQVRYDAIRSFAVRYAVDGNGHLLSAAQFNPSADEPMLTGLTILERNASGQAQRRITAEQAFWNIVSERWDLVGGYGIRPLRHAALTPLEESGVEGAEPVEFFQTDLSPQVLLANEEQLYPRLLSFSDLRQLASNTAINDGPIRRIMHGRFSLLVLNVLVLVVGLPFFLIRGPVNTLQQGVLAAATVLSAWGLGVLVPEVAAVYLNPVASAWLPVVILLPASAVGLQFVRT